jgi:RND superfamily putative drug exporter
MANHLDGPTRREPATVRVAMWSARYRWPVFGLWFVLTIGLLVASMGMGGIDTGEANANPNGENLEASVAYEVFEAGGANDPYEDFYLVIAGGPGAAADPSFQSAVGELISDLRASAVVIDGTSTATFGEIVSPFEAPPQAGLISADGTAVRIATRVPGEAARVRLLLEPVLPIVEATRSAHPELVIHVLNNTFVNDDISELISAGLDESLKLTIPLTIIILLFAFGAVVASLVPLVLAVTSLVAAFGILGIYSQVVGPVSPYATQLVVLIGLAVAIDYSLFMITRFRVERRRGRSRADAIEASSSTAGRAVFFSGLAVMISLASLVTLGITFFTSMAVATVSVVLVSVAGSLTFLPATLAILGDGIDFGRPATWLPRAAGAIPVASFRAWGRSAMAWLDRRSGRREGDGFWGRLVSAVMARPVWLTILSAALLLALGSPVLRLRTGVTDITAFPDSIDAVAGVRILNEKWPQGTQLRLGVVVTDAGRADTQAAIDLLKVEGVKLDGLNEPVEVTMSRNGTAAFVSFTMAGGQNDEANRDLVRQVRTELNPSIFGGLADVRTYVTGGAAGSVDVTQVYTNGTPLIFLFVLGLSFLLMLVAFHSVVIPIKAILLNLLSTAAAYGALVLVFQEGWLAEPLGITPSGVIESWVPLFVFTVLFGLSMDYHLFILTRIKEARDRGADSRAATATGISATSGTITSAASIMVVVFAVFVTLKFVFLQQLGLGLAVAVFIDATVIRSVLLPASMTLLGDWNWWMPRFLDWIPRVTIEGEPGELPEVLPA